MQKQTNNTFTQVVAAASPPSVFKGVLLRAAIISLIIGSILTLVNQWPALFGEEQIQYLPLTLVYVTPFVVVAISQVIAIRKAVKDMLKTQNSTFQKEPFIQTALQHGIPVRAVSLGLIVGSLNTAIVATVILSSGGSVSDLPVKLLAQSYALPVLFGLVSQSISYRRAVAALSATHQAAPGI